MTPHTILFLHGLGSSAAAYDAAIALLDGDQFSCIAHSSVGFGSRSSEAVPNGDLVDFYLHDLLAHHDLPDQVTVVAHSIGGVFAIKLIERLPGTAFNLVLLEANLVSSDCGMLTRTFSSAEPDEIDALRATCIAQFRDHDSAGWRKWADDVALAAPAAIGAYSRTAVERCDSGELLTAYLAHDRPKVYVYGDEYLGEPVLGAIESTPIEYLEGASHFLVPDAAERVAQIIRSTAQRF